MLDLAMTIPMAKDVANLATDVIVAIAKEFICNICS